MGSMESKESKALEVRDEAADRDPRDPRGVRGVRGVRAGGAYCRELSTAQGLEAARELWHELFQDCSRATPCASWEWAQQIWQRFRVWPGEEGRATPSSRLILLSVHEAGGRAIGLAPFLLLRDTSSALSRAFGRRDLCLLGDFGVPGWGFSEEPLLLLRRGHEAAAVRAIRDHFLQRRRALRWDVLNLQFPLWEGGEAAVESMRWSGLRSRMSKAHQEQMQVLALPAGWDEFRRTLSKSLRDNLSYYPRLLTRRGHSWSLRLAQSPAEVAAAVDILVDLHHKRAGSERGLRHNNYLRLPQHREMLRHALPRLAEQGMASIFLLEVDGQTAAALAVLEHQDELMIYISGFDPAWYDFSPLLILTTETIKYAIGKGLQKVNFMCGTQHSKARWGTQGGTIIQRILYVRPRPSSMLRVLLHARAHGLGRGDGTANEAVEEAR